MVVSNRKFKTSCCRLSRLDRLFASFDHTNGHGSYGRNHDCHVPFEQVSNEQMDWHLSVKGNNFNTYFLTSDLGQFLNGRAF